MKVLFHFSAPHFLPLVYNEGFVDGRVTGMLLILQSLRFLFEISISDDGFISNCAFHLLHPMFH